MKYEYDLICIGLGPAGMAVSIMGSAMGLKVCAIEKNKIGGECMNVGCIPSKALLRFSKNRFTMAEMLKRMSESVPDAAEFDKGIFDKIHKDIKFINEKKTLKMFDQVDLMLQKGDAFFVDAHTIQVGDKKVTAQKIFIAAGTEPAVLPIPGMDSVEILTNNNIFSLENIPESLTIIGGGAIGCEMAQSFARLGVKCTIVQMDPYLLPAGDPEAGQVLEQAFQSQGIDVFNSQSITKVESIDGKIQLQTAQGVKVLSDKLLVAAGRRFVLDSLKLENAGIAYGKRGIQVNRHLQTNIKNIYAVGDCNGHFLLSHAAMHQGMLALMNCMMPPLMRFKFDAFQVPWTVFTEPQVSCVGMNEKQLKEKKIKYEVIVEKYENYGAAIAEDVGIGFVKVLASPLGKVYGACIVGEGSGEMINEWALAIQKKIRLHDIMFLQHSFPTMGFLSKRISESWMMNKMKSRTLQQLCKFFFRL